MGRWLRATWTELGRLGARVARRPAYPLMVVGCLAAGVGATTAVFSVVDATLLRPLPYPESEEVAFLGATLEQQPGQRYLVSPANFLEMRDRSTAFAGLHAIRNESVDLLREGEAVRLQGARVTPGLFATLGVPPLRGRTLDRGDAPGVAVLSEGAWGRVLGRDPEAVGRVLQLAGAPVEVVGVIADRHAFPPGTEVFLPFRPEEVADDAFHGGFLQVVGRMAPGVGLTAARADMDRVARELEALYPANNGGRGITVDDLRTPFVQDVRPVLGALMVAVLTFLAVACANVAGLLLVQLRRRTRGLAVRSALGASRGRLVRELVTEGVALASVGGLVGTLAAAAAVPRLVAAVGAAPPGAGPAAPVPGAPPAVADLRVLAFTLIVTLVTAVLFTVGPALLAGRVSPAALLRSGSRGGTGTRGDRRLQSLVVAGQAALGVLLVLAAAGSLDRLLGLVRSEPGYRTDAVTLRVPVSGDRYPTFPARVAFYTAVEEALAALPGVTAVGSTDVLPVGDPGVNWALSVEGRPPADPTAFEVARGRLVTPGLLRALGIPLLDGRGIEAEDRADGVPVVVVSRSFADRYWPGASAVGRRIKRRTYDSPFPWMTVVGVVGDVRDAGQEVPVAPTIYLPYAQQETRLGREMSVVVRGDRAPEELLADARAALARVDGRTPLVRATTVRALLRDSVAAERASGWLLGAFAAGGLLLLALGVYGVMARSVQERRREVGLRMALGARPRGIVRWVLRRGMGLLVAGLVAGLVLAPLALEALGSRLGDPLVAPGWAYPTAALVTLGAGLLASAIPAWRAVRVDPVVSLREE